MEVPHGPPDGLEHRALDGVVRGQGVHPVRQEELELLHRELKEHRLDDLRHRPLAQVQAAHRQAGHVVLLRQLGPEGLGPVGVRPGGVEEDEEGLAQLLELGDHPGLRLQVGLPGQVGDGAVGGDHDANGGVLGNDLPGADLRLQLAHRPGDQIAHAVDEPDGKGPAPLHGDLHRLLGDKLGLGGHHRPAGAALGQFVPGPLPAVFVGDVGQDHGLHKPLDKGGLPRPGGPHHADVDVPRRALGDVLVNACQGIHSMSPPSGCF